MKKISPPWSVIADTAEGTLIGDAKGHKACTVHGYHAKDLIAAAPEMLEVLEEVQSYVDEFGESLLNGILAEMVNNAIKKAKGK